MADEEKDDAQLDEIPTDRLLTEKQVNAIHKALENERYDVHRHMIDNAKLRDDRIERQLDEIAKMSVEDRLRRIERWMIEYATPLNSLHTKFDLIGK